jgi:hypothetical protein
MWAKQKTKTTIHFKSKVASAGQESLTCFLCELTGKMERIRNHLDYKIMLFPIFRNSSNKVVYFTHNGFFKSGRDL